MVNNVSAYYWAQAEIAANDRKNTFPYFVFRIEWLHWVEVQ